MIRTLIVEDEVWERRGLISMIDWAGLGMELAAAVDNGEEALRIMSFEKIDLVLTDMSMPVMDGMRFLKEISKQSYACEIIVISGHASFDYMKQAISSRAQDYILKPFSQNEINEVLRRTILKIAEKMSETEIRETTQSLLEESKPLLKESLLNLLLQPEANNKEDGIRADLSKLGIELSPTQYYRCAVLSIGNAIGFIGQEQGMLVRRVVRSMEALPHEAETFHAFARTTSPAVCVLFGDNDRTKVDTFSAIQSFFSAAMPFFNCMEMITVNIGVGGTMKGLGAVSQSYDQARTASTFENLKHGGLPVYYEDIQNEIGVAPRIFSADDKNLIKEMVHANTGTLSSFVLDRYRQLRDAKYCAIKLLRKNTYDFYLLLEECTRQFNFEFKPHGVGNTIVDVDNMNRLDTVISWVDTLVSDVIFHILNKQEKVSSTFIVEQIIRFIDENYMQDIKLIALANEYYINHIYLSRLFRIQTGQNFIDYLTEVRMKKANVLLKNKTLKVKDVAKMVGFENPYYFTKRYKAFFNVTPTDE